MNLPRQLANACATQIPCRSLQYITLPIGGLHKFALHEASEHFSVGLLIGLEVRESHDDPLGIHRGRQGGDALGDLLHVEILFGNGKRDE